jgi:MFS superfamily sulfate permease-like transporter
MFSLLSGITAAMVILVLFLIKWSSSLQSEVKRRTKELDEANQRLETTNKQLKVHDQMQQEFINIAWSKENVANKTPVIVLSFSGDLKYRDNHWAHRAITEYNRKRSTAVAGAVSVTKNEVKEFLNRAWATFGVFQIRFPSGNMSNTFFMHIGKGLDLLK